MNINEQANFIWSIADLLRGDFKQSESCLLHEYLTLCRRSEITGCRNYYAAN